MRKTLRPLADAQLHLGCFCGALGLFDIDGRHWSMGNAGALRGDTATTLRPVRVRTKFNAKVRRLLANGSVPVEVVLRAIGSA